MKCYSTYVAGNGMEIDAIVAAHSDESALMILALQSYIHGIELIDQRGDLYKIFNDPDIEIEINLVEKLTYDTENPKVIYAILR